MVKLACVVLVGMMVVALSCSLALPDPDDPSEASRVTRGVSHVIRRGGRSSLGIIKQLLSVGRRTRRPLSGVRSRVPTGRGSRRRSRVQQGSCTRSRSRRRRC